MTDDTRISAIVTTGVVLVICTVVFSVRSCTMENNRMEAELQAKCMAERGLWEPAAKASLSYGRCLIGFTTSEQVR